jgi:hypothetical protein
MNAHDPGERHRRIGRHAAASALVALAALANSGTAAAAPAAPLPALTDGSSIAALLLNGREATRLLDADIPVLKTVHVLGDFSEGVTPSRCIGAYLAGQAPAYAGTTTLEVANRLLGKDDDMLIEVVAQLQSPRRSLAHVEATADSWADCAGETVSERTDDGVQQWVLGAPRVNDDRTIVTLSKTNVESSATCERAIASYHDVFIDVLSCSQRGGSDGKAKAVVEAIAEKASRQDV